ncbi:GATA-type zinc finger protein 1 [Betta splendens]|uniref:GATA-type zinc finger protein 1 n=1 Tax=Betta splendens TaxID=158456 RepID=A0A6P7NCU3_BETSP|nr:GATA-type zinc finger protein 1 [Betta splendens]XP_029015624.1 GATA-type zinc finger protein 1 [Betta splendens]XP_055366824.1 GATA-type zinc finger protein 1 [Betta splendens]
MSTEPRPQAAFVQVHQNAAEPDAPNAALFHLFQEVSKLASATQHGLLDARAPSVWLEETTRRGGFIAATEDGARSFQPCQHRLSHVLARGPVSGAGEGGRATEFTAGGLCECSSPWKVLSLINLQCERLMRRRGADASAHGTATSATNVPKDHAPVQPRTASTDAAERGCARPAEGRDQRVQPQLQEDAAPPPQNRHAFITKQDVLSHNALPSASQQTMLTFQLNEDAEVALSKQPFTLDCNENIVLTAEPLFDTQLPPPSSMLPASPSFRAVECPEPGLETTGPEPECTHSATEEDFPSVSAQAQSQSACSAASKQDPRELSQQWRAKTPRKQPHPSRSVDIQDPDLQGVTFRMDTEVDDSREQCRLLITSKYRKDLCKSVRKPRLRTRASQKSLKSSSSEEESDPANVSKDKVCASCCTRKTPMWRDAEDGTPLCNACGIRYKKYRVRCVNCWHIPRKEGNSNSCCLKCGNFVKLASTQRKHNT